MEVPTQHDVTGSCCQTTEQLYNINGTEYSYIHDSHHTSRDHTNSTTRVYD